MELTPEEKQRIYEEERARIEAEQFQSKTKRREKYEADEQTRTHRITSSSVAIAWSLALIIFFSFFRQYLAYYQIEQTNGINGWVRYEILTPDFKNWVLVLTIVLCLSIIGHIIALVFDRYLIRQSILTTLRLLGIGTIIYLLYLFPFNFSAIPYEGDLVVMVLLKTLLIIILVVLSIVTLTNLIKLIVRIVTKTATY
jgi:hypothetical protein